ncbi:MAG: hypothetical protein GVY02_08590, partial [Bacteroidetes bacterium]|nr:hypothetical protein [Bacteroidota bacterium]
MQASPFPIRHSTIFSGLGFILILLLIVSCTEETDRIGAAEDWPVSLGDKMSSQYSHLDQITRKNVDQLEIAWSYQSGDADTVANSQIQANPLIIDRTLYT